MPGPVSTRMGDRIGVQLPLRVIYLSLTNHSGQLSLAIPPWVGAMSTGQRAVMLCDWGVKADMVLFAGNTVWSISERVRCVCVDALYKSMFTLLYFTLPQNIFRSVCGRFEIKYSRYHKQSHRPSNFKIHRAPTLSLTQTLILTLTLSMMLYFLTVSQNSSEDLQTLHNRPPY